MQGAAATSSHSCPVIAVRAWVYACTHARTTHGMVTAVPIRVTDHRAPTSKNAHEAIDLDEDRATRRQTTA